MKIYKSKSFTNTTCTRKNATKFDFTNNMNFRYFMELNSVKPGSVQSWGRKMDYFFPWPLYLNWGRLETEHLVQWQCTIRAIEKMYQLVLGSQNFADVSRKSNYQFQRVIILKRNNMFHLFSDSKCKGFRRKRAFIQLTSIFH